MMKQIYLLTTKRRDIFLALLLLIVMPITAQNVNDQFKVGNLFYIIKDATNHKVYVTDDPSNTDPENTYQKTLSGHLTIPETVSYKGKSWTVVGINARAFADVESITSVTLPPTIEYIRGNAFENTTNLKSINFPAALKLIGNSAFETSGLEKVDIPGKTSLGISAFAGCESLTSVSFPHIDYLGLSCFAKCIRLKTISLIPKGVLEKTSKTFNWELDNSEEFTDRGGTYCFHHCISLESVTIEDGVTLIPEGLFAECNELKEINLPSSVETISDQAFVANFSLKKVSMPGVKTIGHSAFYNCDLEGDLVIPENVKSIETNGFGGNCSLTSFTWKGGAGCMLGRNSFGGCVNLEFVDLHTLENLKKIEDGTIIETSAPISRTDMESIYFGLPTHTVVYLPKMPTGKEPTFAEGEDVNFVRQDSTCTLLSVQDGADYEFPNEFKATKAVYNKFNAIVESEDLEDELGRIYKKFYFGEDNSLTTYRDFSGISNGKNCFTMLLPYEVNVPKGFRAYKLEYRGTYNKPVQGEGEYEYRDYYLFRSIPDGEPLEANKPYLLRITDGQAHTSQDIVAADNVQVAASGSTKVNDDGTEVTQTPSNSALCNVNAGTLKPQGFAVTGTKQSYNFVGGTERLNNHLAVKLNTWLLNTDSKKIDVWRKVEEFEPIPGSDAQMPSKTTAAPFRGYIQPIDNKAPAKPFVILTDDEAAAIDSLEQGTPLTGEQGISTLDGRYAGNDLKALPSGIYVIKGKKIAK